VKEMGKSLSRTGHEVQLQKDAHPGSISERVALRNALTTLADLQRIAYARKPSGSVRREGGQAIRV
jgi:hypothetical protein